MCETGAIKRHKSWKGSDEMYRSTSGAMSYPMIRTVLLVCFVAFIFVSDASGYGKRERLKVVKNTPPDVHLIEGDIRLRQTDQENGEFEKRQLIRTNRKWNKNDIPYIFKTNITDLERIQPGFQEAVDYYKANTCIRFRKTTKEEAQNLDHIEVINDDACYSDVGQTDNNSLSLGDRCEDTDTILHELGHALGFTHTQSRYDRDNYLKLNLNNVNASEKYNYAKHKEAENENYGLPYDFLSIMQYGDGGFAINENISVMTPRNPLYKYSMGQNFELTFIDLKMLNRFYNCPESCKNKIKCKNSGFQNSNKCDECVCPSGFGGPNCNVRAGSDDPSTDCGKTLKAKSKKWSTLNATFDSSCTWWINAGKKKHVEIQFLDVAIDQSEKCKDAGLDVKLESPLLTGFRVCDEIPIPSVKKFVSKGNRAILRAYVNKPGSQQFVLQYRQVN